MPLWGSGEKPVQNSSTKGKFGNSSPRCTLLHRVRPVFRGVMWAGVRFRPVRMEDRPHQLFVVVDDDHAMLKRDDLFFHYVLNTGESSAPNLTAVRSDSAPAVWRHPGCSSGYRHATAGGEPRAVFSLILVQSLAFLVPLLDLCPIASILMNWPCCFRSSHRFVNLSGPTPQTSFSPRRGG